MTNNTQVGYIIDGFARVKSLVLLSETKEEKHKFENELSAVIALESPIINAQNHLTDILVKIHVEREKIIRKLRNTKKSDYINQSSLCDKLVTIQLNRKRAVDELNKIKYPSNVNSGGGGNGSGGNSSGCGDDNGNDTLISLAPPELMIAKKFYHETKYKHALDHASCIAKKYNIKTTKPSQEQIEVYLFYIMCAAVVKANYSEYFDFISYNVMKKLDTLNLTIPFKNYLKKEYTLYSLRHKRYDLAAPYISSINTSLCEPLGISPSTISFFKSTDIDKTLLIYWGGGKGDIIMHARFIPIICRKFNMNNVIFMSESSLTWMFEKTFGKSIDNLKIVNFDSKHTVMKDNFDYHVNINMLMTFLQYDHKDIPFCPYLQSLGEAAKDLTLPLPVPKNTVINSESNKNRIGIFNWHGGYNNSHEPLRGMPIDSAIALFEIPDITWQCCTLDISPYERKILDKYGVQVLENIDTSGKAFEDTIKYIAQSDFIITTDTSLAHLAGTMGEKIVDTHVLLSQNYDWRWECLENNNEKLITPWYPNMHLYFKGIDDSWQDIVNRLVKKLSKVT